MVDAIQGILVLDERGQVAFASGVGSDRRLQTMVANRAWLSELVERRLQAVSLDGNSSVALATPWKKGVLIVISEPPGDSVLDFVGSVDIAYDIFEHLLTDPFDAMTVVDSEARVTFISPVHEAFFGLSHGNGNGRHVREIIENTRLDKVVASGKAEVGEIQRMKGSDRVVSRIPIRRNGRVVGAVGRVMFKGPQQLDEMSRRINALESDVEFYRREAASLRSSSYGLDSLIGNSKAIQRLRQDIVKLAPLEMPILIQGESGTGKELVAHALHRLSPRRDAALVVLNAAALPATLVESELFGYEAGAFTGADRKGRKGKFEQAAGGTIFLDEIGDMPVEVQVKLLRVLQDRIVERIGGDKAREVDFRLVTATNRDLRTLVAGEKFRLDLYYRISPIVIEVPPLRHRVEDIGDLARHFLAEVARRHGRPEPEITEDALIYLMGQPWPGNIRQLRHEVERAFVFAEQGQISIDVLTRFGDAAPASSAPASMLDPKTLKGAVGRTEAALVDKTMRMHNGNKKRVAEELGISRSYLYKILAGAEAG